MGAASSTAISTQKSDTNIVNVSDLKLLNKSINNFTNNTAISNAKSCGAGIIQSQNISFDDLVADGDINISGVAQKQTAALSFSCIQDTQVKNDVANGVMSEYLNAIKNSFSSDVLSEMTSQAAASAKQSFGSFGSADAVSVNDMQYNFNSTTVLNQDIQNVVENAISNNFKMEDLQTCASSIDNNQNIKFKKLSSGRNINIKDISQEQAATLFSECIQNTKSASETTNAIASKLGLKIENESSTTAKSIMSGISSAISSSTGLDLGFGSISASCGSCCCIIIVIIVIIVILKMKGNPAISSAVQGEARKLLKKY
jgi:hypothetical protein